jgi:hypothetical protein
MVRSEHSAHSLLARSQVNNKLEDFALDDRMISVLLESIGWLCIYSRCKFVTRCAAQICQPGQSSWPSTDFVVKAFATALPSLPWPCDHKS